MLLSPALMGSAGYANDLQFVGGPTGVNQVYDYDDSYVGSVLIKPEKVIFKAFGYHGDGTAYWTKKSGASEAARAVASIASALVAGYGFDNAIAEFGEGYLTKTEPRYKAKSKAQIDRMSWPEKSKRYDYLKQAHPASDELAYLESSLASGDYEPTARGAKRGGSSLAKAYDRYRSDWKQSPRLVARYNKGKPPPRS